ncbi:MAG: hypothetical protein ABI885_02545 [Gammaproteobacteria bacterium]
MLNTPLKPNQRVVSAPASIIPASAGPLPNRVVAVVLGPEEDVEWIWTTTAEGAEYVSGYNIFEK